MDLPTIINEMSSDTHIVDILDLSPCINGQTNPLPRSKKHNLQFLFFPYEELHTIPHHCIERGYGNLYSMVFINSLNPRSFTIKKGNLSITIILARTVLSFSHYTWPV